MSLENIKSRGHWVIKIRPGEFVERRIDRISTLEEHLQAAAVNARGWDFPHIDHTRQNLVRHADHIQQDFEWHLFKEHWRFYLSGQFVFLGSFWGEWRDQSPGNFGPLDNSTDPVLIVPDVIGKWTEILLFASKLMARMKVENVEVDISLFGLQGRALYVPPVNRMPLIQPRISRTESYNSPNTYEVRDLSQRYKTYAVQECLRLFDVFGWNTSEEMIVGFQNEVFRGSTI